MSISEQVGFLDDAIKGHVKVQLMEKDKVVQEVGADNFIGNAVYNWLLALLSTSFRDFFRDGTAAYDTSSSAFFSTPCLTNFYLTDNEQSIPTTASTIPGTIIGYVSARPYSSSATDRGTVNSSESALLGGNKIKIVMDFATNAANGTFRTLGFGSSERSFLLPNKGLISTYNISGQYGRGDADVSSGYVVDRYSDTTLRIHRIIDKSVGIYTYSNVTYHKCCVRGTTGYLVNITTREVWSVDLTNPATATSLGTIASLPVGLSSAEGAIKTDGTYLYLIGSYSNTKYFSAILTSNLSVARNNVQLSGFDSSDFNDHSSCLHTTGGNTYATSFLGNRVNLTNFVAVGTGASLQLTATGRFSTGSEYNYIIAIDDNEDRCFAAPGLFPYFSSAREANTSTNYILAKQSNITTGLPLGTCVVLPAPVTKTSEQTMKITYELTFNFK